MPTDQFDDPPAGGCGGGVADDHNARPFVNCLHRLIGLSTWLHRSWHLMKLICLQNSGWRWPRWFWCWIFQFRTDTCGRNSGAVGRVCRFFFFKKKEFSSWAVVLFIMRVNYFGAKEASVKFWLTTAAPSGGRSRLLFLLKKNVKSMKLAMDGREQNGVE